MSNNFDVAFNYAIPHEGGYVDHEDDRGGATKYGITIGTLERWRRQPVTKDDVKDLELDEAKMIYKTMYFDPLRLGEVNNGISAAILFDQAINRGPTTVAREVQFLIGVKADGILGPITLDTLNSVDQHEFQIEFFKLCQLAYIEIVRKNPSQLVFIRGWINRTHEMLSFIEYSDLGNMKLT